MRQCEVYVHDRKAGILTEKARNDYEFCYDTDYLKSEGAVEVSLTLPLQEQPYHSKVLFPFFFNMLSEGENRELQSRMLHIDKDDDFGILLATCQYDTIGAVTVKPIKS